MVQISPVPSTELHPVHPPNVPFGAAVNVIIEPLTKLVLQLPAVLAQLNPVGELVTVPEPVPAKFRVSVGPEAPPPVPV
jgi:hypothetical protein